MVRNTSQSEYSLKRTKRRRFIKATGGAVAFGALAGCLGDDDDEDGPITIGSLQPLSGDFAAWGQVHGSAMQFAVDEINENGGVLGRDLEITESDTESNPGQADTTFRRMVEEDGAVALAGPVSSDVGIATRETAEEMEVPLILHMAGSHQILPKDVRYCFRMGSHSAVTDMLSVMGLIEQEGYTEIAAINGDYEWGRSVETTIEALLPDGVNLDMQLTPLGESDFSPFIRDFPDDVEIILASGHPPGSIAIHNQAREIGVGHDFTVGAGLPPGVLVGALGENAETFLHQHVSDPFTDRFNEVAERYVEETGERFDTHEAYGYSSVQVIANAIEEADSTDPADIADGIRDVEHDVLLANPIEYVDYGEVENLVHMLSPMHFEPPEYDPDGEWRLEEFFRSDPIEAFDPDEWDFDDV